MGKIIHEIEIDAPADEVWHAVHGDIPNVPKWSSSLRKTEVVGGGAARKGSKLQYEVAITGGRTITLELRIDEMKKPRRCAGEIIDGPIGGTWSWTYSSDGDTTRVVYESELKVGGMLRFLKPVIEKDVNEGTKRDLADLKSYVESGGD